MKTCQEIYEEMAAEYARQTGFQMDVQADLAVRLYAAAAQIESLYAYCDWVLRQSFPQEATGESLDRHAALRGLTRKEGVCAQGSLRFSVGEARSDDVTVPVGTVCSTAGLVRFVTTKKNRHQSRKPVGRRTGPGRESRRDGQRGGGNRLPHDPGPGGRHGLHKSGGFHGRSGA